jgi:hypothetical protein
MNASRNDRRETQRGALFLSRRRYPRLSVKCDVYYESEDTNVLAEEVDVSLRGLFVPCRFPDREGAHGVVRIDLGEGSMVRAEVEVVRIPELGRSGMALRIVQMAEGERLRFAGFMLRKGGLAVLPQLDRRWASVARAPRLADALLAA